ncbi:hypothetical protein E2C01_069242 [Portunus trituberculatus]|uniref:Uncharacterized protein n=1 Tax=Portunus trituberculatus TaxID=210409 RepID=A0A5B7I2A1_PORTR|nr:hypothetical protein [Portunus trituberculatus]
MDHSSKRDTAIRGEKGEYEGRRGSVMGQKRRWRKRITERWEARREAGREGQQEDENLSYLRAALEWRRAGEAVRSESAAGRGLVAKYTNRKETDGAL